MRQQLIDKHQVHIVVVRPEVAAGDCGNITVAEQGCSHFLQLPGASVRLYQVPPARISWCSYL